MRQHFPLSGSADYCYTGHCGIKRVGQEAALAAGDDQVTQQHVLDGSIQAAIAKGLGHRNDVGVAGSIIVGCTKADLDSVAQDGTKFWELVCSLDSTMSITMREMNDPTRQFRLVPRCTRLQLLYPQELLDFKKDKKLNKRER